MVFPGSFLGTEEEFLPGENCFEQSSSVYSDSIGKEHFDFDEKVVSVKKLSPDVSMLSIGNVVHAVVVLVKDQACVLEILEMEDLQKPGKKVVSGSKSSVLPVFSVMNSYVKFMSDYFKIGDIVRARVEKISPTGIELETKSSPGLGVVMAYCVSCRSALKLVEAELKCSNCGSNERRKISADYSLK